MASDEALTTLILSPRRLALKWRVWTQPARVVTTAQLHHHHSCTASQHHNSLQLHANVIQHEVITGIYHVRLQYRIPTDFGKHLREFSTSFNGRMCFIDFTNHFELTTKLFSLQGVNRAIFLDIDGKLFNSGYLAGCYASLNQSPWLAHAPSITPSLATT